MERKIAAVRTLKQARAFLLCVRSQPARVAEAQVLEMVALAWSEGKLFARRLEREILVSRLHYAYSLAPKSVEVWWLLVDCAEKAFGGSVLMTPGRFSCLRRNECE